jgi:hypothetical protein
MISGRYRRLPASEKKLGAGVEEPFTHNSQAYAVLATPVPARPRKEGGTMRVRMNRARGSAFRRVVVLGGLARFAGEDLLGDEA